MFTLVIQVDDSGQFIDVDLQNAPMHIPVEVKEEIIHDVDTEFEEE